MEIYDRKVSVITILKKRTVEECNDYLVNKYSKSFKELPRKIEIETINRCNGKCTFCPVNVNEPQRPYAKMTEELFHKIIDDLVAMKYSNTISLFSNNEPFLDERIISWHKYVRERLPKCEFVLFTNGSLLTVEKFTEIMQYLDKMVVDNYSDGEKINDNLVAIKELAEKKDAYKSRVVFSVRKEDEVLTSRGGFAPNKRETKVLTTKCVLPFQHVIIRPDGKISLCCNDALGKMTLGDCNTQSIEEIWRGKGFGEVRKKMIENGRSGIDICRNCDTVGGQFTWSERSHL